MSNQFCLTHMQNMTLVLVTQEMRGHYSLNERMMYAKDLAINFCRYYGLAYCDTKVLNEPRPRGTDNKHLYGYYKNKTAVVYNLTPKTLKPISFPVFFDTLTHELLHHKDQCEYGLSAEHDNKFYKRLNELQTELLQLVKKFNVM